MTDTTTRTAPPSTVLSRTYLVDGMRSHVLEAGDGRPVVLLHGGEWGGCAALTWEAVIPVLAEHYRVIAPDWLGFGQTAKVVDLADPMGRRLAHMRRLLETIDAIEAAFVGNSMGGGLLLAAITADPPLFDARAVILAGAGGFVPDNEARRAGFAYDGTLEGMRAFLGLLFSDTARVDDALVERWHRLSLVPGAYESMASLMLAPPGTPKRSPFGRPDPTPYERIQAPTLVVGGADDQLRLDGWLDEFVPRIPNGRGVLYESCGHLVPVDASDRFNRDALAFLLETYPPTEQ